MLGLLAGTTGIGVLMARAVYEQRRQIGLLRAIGAGQRLVQATILVEATAIAAQGILFGVVPALLTSYELLFSVPWPPLLLLATGIILASVVSSTAAAHPAVGVRPAGSLRDQD